MFSLTRIIFFISALLIAVPNPAHALPSVVSDILTHPEVLSAYGLTDPFITTLGVTLDHRAYEPATPLGTHPGFNVGLEATVIQVPGSVINKFSEAGLDLGELPFLPSARLLNVHKGLSENVDAGGSVFLFSQYLIWSADLKVVVYEPEEGPTFALRLNYTNVHMPLGSINETTPFGDIGGDLSVSTHTWTPQILLSKRLEFADPYVGVAYQIVDGSVDIKINNSIPGSENFPEIPTSQTLKGAGSNFFAFLGLSLQAPLIGVRVTIEGSYSPKGYNAMGAKVGLAF